MGGKKPHKCSRDDCETVNVSGPKVNCLKCKNQCYLQCFGFEKGPTIDSNDTVKKVLADGTVVVMFMACMAFVCCDKTVSATDVRAGLKMPSKRDTSKAKSTSNDTIAKEMKAMKELLLTIKTATDMNSTDIAAMKSLSQKTEENVQKLADESAQTPNRNRTAAPGLSYVQAFRARGAALANSSPALKRKRNDSEREKVQYPTPKSGTKTNVNGLSTVPKPMRTIDAKPKFEKALWVSRFKPDVSNEEVANYITTSTPINDKERIAVHKLVKKDADLSTLKFVSFKIEMSAEDLDILNDSSLWPEDVLVREFVMVPKNTLGSHFPHLNAKESAPTTPHSTDPMELS